MNTYQKRLEAGVYGIITDKHRKLAVYLESKGITTFEAMRDYCSQYKKYNSWTLRDFDKVSALKASKI